MVGIQLSLSKDTNTLIKIVDILQIDCFQFFLDNDASLSLKREGYELRNTLKTLKSSFSIKKIYVHAPYSLYIGGRYEKTRINSWRKIKQKLIDFDELNIDGFIIHLSIDDNIEIDSVYDEAEKVLFNSNSKTPLLFENIAVKNTYGSNMNKFEKFITLIGELISSGVCLDTAHLFEAGYSFDTKPIANELRDTYPKIFEKTVILHVNDSKTPLGSYIDQHENLGKGYIGLGGLGAILSVFNPNIAFITEPSTQDFDVFIKNISILKDLLYGNNK
jgi:deoxyribonuclease IV